jgi:hypothetical protein
MANMEGSGDVGWRNYQTKGRGIVLQVRLEEVAFNPKCAPSLFHFTRVVGFI